MFLFWLTFAASTLISLTAADIDCYYCGYLELCELPYKADSDDVDHITCPDSCMKFDGYAEDGKRVLARGCAPETLETNVCVPDFDYHGAKGEICQCNAAKCNGADGGMKARSWVNAALAALMAVMMGLFL